jgi:hypothetical protein
MLTRSEDGNMLRIFERRILKMIYGPIDGNGTWRTRYNKLYTLYDELGLTEVIKMERLWWLGYLVRMQELDRSRKLLKPEGTQHVGRPRLM